MKKKEELPALEFRARRLESGGARLQVGSGGLVTPTFHPRASRPEPEMCFEG